MPLDKNAIIRDAQKYTARGQIEKAVAEWQKLLRESPNDGNIYNTIGDLYLRIKAQKEAIESYRKAAGIFQKDGFTLKALALYKKIININPNQIDAMISLAELNAERGLIGNANENYLVVAEYYTKEGAVSRALEIYERMVNINPDNINLRMKLAEMYIREGRQEDGIKKYIDSAAAYSEKGDIQKAKELYNKALSYRPKDLETLKGLCIVYQKEGNHKESFEIIRKAKELFPDRKDVLILYGKSGFHAGRLEEAKTVLVKYLNVETGDREAREYLAKIYLKEGNKDSSIEEYRTILNALMQKNELEGAISLLEQMIDIDHENPNLHHNLADVYRKLGRERDVKKEYEFLVSIYINQGDSEKATNILKSLIEMDPANMEFRRKLEEMQRAAEEIPPIPTFVEKPFEEEIVKEVEPQEVIKIVPEKLEVKKESEALAEADVYMRYGLVERAIGIIRNFLDVNPGSIKSHIMLKDIFKIQGMKNEFVEECLTLADIYQKAGNEDVRLGILNEALEIEPEDKRILGILRPEALTEMVELTVSEKEIVPEEVSKPVEIEEEVIPEVSPEKEAIPDVIEEWIAEADFYAQQGLAEDAIKVYREILNMQPENEDIQKKIEALSEVEEEAEDITFGEKEHEPFVFEEPQKVEEEEITLIKEKPEAIVFEEPLKEVEEEITFIKEETEPVISEEPQKVNEEEIPLMKDELLEEEIPFMKEEKEEIPFMKEEPQAVVIEESNEEFIDFAAELKEEMEAQVPESPFGDKNLQEIFQEFKKGVDREVGEKDYETHYNLGIAYKEMGLIDEAINEFQTVARDPSWHVQASSMLGFCFLEKELYQLAIKEFMKAINSVEEGTDEYLSLKYDLGDVYEKAGMLEEALGIYTDIYGINTKFREVTSRIDNLKKRVGDIKLPSKKAQKTKKDRVSYL